MHTRQDRVIELAGILMGGSAGQTLIKGKIPFSLFEESKDWGVEEKDLKRNLDCLVQRGWMEILGYKADRPLVRITVAGIDEYRRTHKDS